MADRTCSIEGCGRAVFARDWCRRHWQDWRETQPGRLRDERRTTCSIPGCEGKHCGLGLCSLHLNRLQRTGDPLKVRKRARATEACVVDGCDRVGTGGRLMCSLHYQRWKAHGGTERLQRAGDNRFEVVDLLTGQLIVVRADETEHVSIYDLADHGIVSAHRWVRNPGGYLTARMSRRIGSKTLLLHRLLLGLPHGDKRLGDHINGDRLDNRRANLRIADYKLNAANQAVINDAGTSKYRGVCWAKACGKWKAYAHVDGKLCNLGFFATEEEAAAVVIDFRAAHHVDTGYLRRHPHTPQKASRG